jgi:hypothetical protein
MVGSRISTLYGSMHYTEIATAGKTVRWFICTAGLNRKIEARRVTKALAPDDHRTSGTSNET